MATRFPYSLTPPRQSHIAAFRLSRANTQKQHSHVSNVSTHSKSCAARSMGLLLLFLLLLPRFSFPSSFSFSLNLSFVLRPPSPALPSLPSRAFALSSCCFFSVAPPSRGSPSAVASSLPRTPVAPAGPQAPRPSHSTRAPSPPPPPSLSFKTVFPPN